MFGTPAPGKWPMLFAHGMAGALDTAVDLELFGVTVGIDLYEVVANPEAFDLRQFFSQLRARNLRCMPWVRWKDPDPPAGNPDKAPTSMQTDDAIALVQTQLSTDEARELTSATVKATEPMLWARLSVEPISGPALMVPDEQDGLFTSFTSIAVALRSSHPNVKLVSGGLTLTELLDQDTYVDQTKQARRDLLGEWITFTRDYLDAIAIHPKSGSAAEFDASLAAVDAYNARSGNPLAGKYVVLPEFGIDDQEDREDVDGACVELRKMVRIARERGVYWMAKRPGPENPAGDPNDPERFKWSSLVDENGNPKQPFYRNWQQQCVCAKRRLGVALANP